MIQLKLQWHHASGPGPWNLNITTRSVTSRRNSNFNLKFKLTRKDSSPSRSLRYTTGSAATGSLPVTALRLALAVTDSEADWILTLPGE